MKLIFRKITTLHPENYSELETMAKKWNVTIHEICKAIVETGTTSTKEIKDHLRKTKFQQNHLRSLRKIYNGMYVVGR